MDELRKILRQMIREEMQAMTATQKSAVDLRIGAGYFTRDDLVDAVKDKTGVKLHPSSLARYETGAMANWDHAYVRTRTAAIARTLGIPAHEYIQACRRGGNDGRPCETSR